MTIASPERTWPAGSLMPVSGPITLKSFRVFQNSLASDCRVYMQQTVEIEVHLRVPPNPAWVTVVVSSEETPPSQGRKPISAISRV